MAHRFTIKANKTYATEENAVKAVEAKFSTANVRYFIQRTAEGRFFPVFVGEAAVHAGVHFHFNVIG